jgi:hypothetical protein
MPKILEMKMIDGELWCRVPEQDMIPHEEGSVSLYYPQEITDLQLQAVKDFLYYQLCDFKDRLG